MRLAVAAFAGVAALGALGACSHPPPPRQPDITVSAELTAAETAERARRHDEARSHYERAVAAAHDPRSIARARHDYAETLVSWGEAPAAQQQLELAAEAAPTDAGVWHDLGLLRHHAGDDPGAIQALQRAEQLAPDDARPRTALAALYWRRGDKTSAAAEYRGLLQLDLPERLREKVEWALGELAKP